MARQNYVAPEPQAQQIAIPKSQYWHTATALRKAGIAFQYRADGNDAIFVVAGDDVDAAQSVLTGSALAQSEKRSAGFMENFGTYTIVVLGLLAAPFVPQVIPVAIVGALTMMAMHALDNAVMRRGVRQVAATGDAWKGKRLQDVVSWGLVVVLFVFIVLGGGIVAEWRLGMEHTIGVWP